MDDNERPKEIYSSSKHKKGNHESNRVQPKGIYLSPKHKKISLKKIVTIVAIAVLLTAGIVSVWLSFIQPRISENPTSLAQSEKIARNEKTEKILNELDYIVAENGPESAQTFLDSKIKDTTDSKEQAQLYSIKSSYWAFDSIENNQSAALESAYKAEELSPDEDTAYSIAYLEEKAGNIANAIKYYKIFISRIPKPSQVYDNDFEYYSDYIKTLGAEIK